VTGTEEDAFRLAYVPGVTPGKWARTWAERVRDVPLVLSAMATDEALEALRGEAADAGLLRVPIDRSGMHAIPLYTEATVVVVPKDHEVAGVDELAIADLAGYVVLHPLDDCLGWDTPPGTPANERPPTTADAIELAAAGVGLLVVPQSLARLHHRKDLTYRPVLDAPQSSVALVWPEERTTDLMEEFIGIVRGRTANSSRGPQRQPESPPKQKPARNATQNPDRQKRATASAKTGKTSKAAKPAKTGKPRRRAR
jgi:DNA-binding transcriptional LysR family regulator